MNNPLFSMMGGGMPNGLQSVMQRFQQFRSTFQGDPREQVQQLLNSGRVNQAQYNQAYQMAQQLQRMLGGK